MKPGLHLVDGDAVAAIRTGAHVEIPAPIRSVAAGCLSDAIGIHRLSHGQFGLLAGVSRQQVERWCDPGVDQWINAPRVLMAAQSPRGRTVALSYITTVRGQLGDEPEPLSNSGPGLLAQTFDVLADVGRLADDVRLALADGVVTDRERQQLLRGAQDAQARLLALTRELNRRES